jgi:hypothetical protein
MASSSDAMLRITAQLVLASCLGRTGPVAARNRGAGGPLLGAPAPRAFDPLVTALIDELATQPG